MDINSIQVKMLGEFSVSCGGIEISERNNRSKTARILLAYLLYYWGRMVPISELISILGSDTKNTAPIAALRTALYRVRRVIEPLKEQVGQPLIISQNGMYGWNPSVSVWFDTVEFERMCRVELSEEEKTECKCTDYYQKVLALYHGDFLQGLASEQWVQPIAEYYRNLYLTEVERAIPVLVENGLARKAVEYGLSAIRLAPYQEDLYGRLISAYVSLNEIGNAKAVYEQLRALLYKDLGAIPGKELQCLYETILMDSEEEVLTPDTLRSQLQEQNPISGALICDYQSFKFFYQAEARSAARRGDAIHIGILSVTGRGEKPLVPRNLSRAMEQLHRQIERCLRTGDIASRCNASQYILMLVQANYENSELVCERIIQSFYAAYPRSPIRIQSEVFPLEPSLKGLEAVETGAKG